MLGPARALLPLLGCLESAVVARSLSAAGFASLVSSLGAAAVSRPVVPAWFSRVPRASSSEVVSLRGAVVWAGGDSVFVRAEGVVRECRVSYLPRAGLPAVSPAAVLESVSRRVAAGERVRFVAAFGYSPDRWFCGLFPA